MTRTIKGKLTIALILTNICFLIVILFSMARYEDMIYKYESLTDNVSYSENIQYMTDEITNLVTHLYASNNKVTAGEIESQLQLLITNSRLLQGTIENESSKFILRRLDSAIDEFESYAEKVVLYMDEDNTANASIYRDTTARINVSINTIVSELINSELSHMQLLRIELEKQRQVERFQSVVLYIGFVSVLMYGLWRLNTSIFVNVKKLLYVFHKIGEGNLNFEVPTVETKDEFKRLMDQADEMKESIKDLTQEKMASKSAIITAVGSLAEMRDKETGEHIHSVQDYLRMLCTEMMKKSKYHNILTNEYVDNLIQVAPLHDIGKVGIPDKILLKPGKLTTEEFEIMKSHVEKGQQVIKQAVAIYNRKESSYFDIAEEVIADHHEKWDGSGYPRGLEGEQISLAGRLIAITDVYDALTSNRVYKNAYSHQKAIEIIKEGRGKHFDPYIVDIFMEIETSIKAVKE